MSKKLLAPKLIPGAKNYQMTPEGVVTNTQHNTPVFAQKDGSINVIDDDKNTMIIKDPKKFARELFSVSNSKRKEIPGCEDYDMDETGAIWNDETKIPIKNNQAKLKSTEGGDYTITDCHKLFYSLFPGKEFKETEVKPIKRSEKVGGKVAEIWTHFEAGKSNAEIVELGFNKGTVSVQRGKFNKIND